MVIRVPESVFHNSDHPGRNKDVLKKHCALPFGCQTIRTVDSKNLELPHIWHTGKEKAEAWITKGRVCVQKRVYNSSGHPTGGTGIKVMVAGATPWPGTTLFTSCLLIKPKVHVRSLKTDLGKSEQLREFFVPFLMSFSCFSLSPVCLVAKPGY